MNTKTSLILMVLFIVLGTFAFFDPLHTKEKAELKKDVESHVFWLKDKVLESMEIHQGSTDIELRCIKEAGCPLDPNGDWKIEKPVQDLADPASVGAAVGSVLNLTQNDKIALGEGVDAKEFGFDPPAAEVSLHVKGDPEPYQFKIGTAKLVGGAGAYVLTNRDPNTVYIVGSFFPGMFLHDLFHWRNKRIFPQVSGEQVQAMEWSNKSGLRLSAVKEGANWKLESPEKSPANNALLAGLASTIAFLDMKSVFAEDPKIPEAKKVLAQKPEWVISFKNEKGETEKATLYAPPGKDPSAVKTYVVQRAGDHRLFLIDGVPIERFNKAAIEYRDRRILVNNELAKASEIALNFPREKKSIVLKPDKSGWAYASGDKPGEPLSRERIDAFFRALSGAEADKFLVTGVASDPAVAFFEKQPADLEVEFRANGQVLSKRRFTVHSRQEVLTESPVEGQLASLGGPFLKMLPVRFVDLYASNNKQVVTSESKGEEHGEHSHSEHEH